MIIATKHDDTSKYDDDTNVFLDIDLSVLGSCSFDYEIYVAEIKDEYKMVSSIGFLYGRKRVLKSLLQRQIYKTSVMRQKYEESAKLNIRSELRKWRYRFIPSKGISTGDKK